MLNKFFAGAAMAAVMVSTAASAQQVPDWQAEIFDQLPQMLEEGYIYEDVGMSLAASVREMSSDFAHLDTQDEFISAVNHELYALSNDAHLTLRYRPATEAGNTRRRRPSNCATGDITWRMEADNIGYISVPRIQGDEAYRAGFDTAMTELTDADAIILDVRNNCGGDPRTLIHFASWFFREPTHLTSTEGRDRPTRERWTSDDVAGARYADRPLVILTNERSFSAAESFTFGMKISGRATVVGEATGGGGHWGQELRLSDELVVFMPQGRTYDPRTGLGWEAQGVQPDIVTSSDEALAAALTYLAEL